MQIAPPPEPAPVPFMYNDYEDDNYVEDDYYDTGDEDMDISYGLLTPQSGSE